MKRIIITATALLFTSYYTFSQTAVSRTYIKGGRDAWENYLREAYQYQKFEDGIVEYKNGKRFKGKLNYNRVIGNIQFIAETGDTLALAEPEKIDHVTIGESLFYTQPVCLLKVTGGPKAMLLKNEKVKVADKQRVGAHGIPNNSATIDSYDRTYTRNLHYLDINEQLLIRKTAIYYIGLPGETFIPASKKNVISLFPGRKNEVSKFIEDKKIDFNQEADLVALTQYMQEQ